jgi:glucoamylase
VKKILFFAIFAWLSTFAVYSQTLAPGAPGQDAQWATAGKQGVGTSATLESKIWFTLAQGVMTEVYYPDVTVANVHLLQFVVVNPKTKKVETEQDDAIHQIKVLRPDSLSFQQINTAKSGEWKITKTYITDVERDSVLIDVRFEPKNKNLTLYIYYDPSLGNSGMGDKAYSPLLQLKGNYEYERTEITKDGVKRTNKSGEATVSGGMGAEDGKFASVLFVTSDIEEYSNGYYKANDWFEQLRKYGNLKQIFAEASNGNVIQIARIMKPSRFTVILGFGEDIWKASVSVAGSHKKGFIKAQAEYDQQWADYIKNLPKIEPKYQAQFNMAAMVLKAHEDKTARGANIASLTVPWGGGANANENNIGGYHLIWSRDLYQVATAFMALGDKDAAIRALDFLFKVQQKEDGSFPQNSFLDGKPFWGSLQLDEVAFPLILAHELGKNDKETYEKHVKKAADFIIKNGPATPQERWEEESGYSPSTIAAEIAGLVCAAEIARKNGDTESANRWLKTADDWAANIEKWTVTTTGKYSKEPYYVRITQNGKPDAGEKIELNNGAGFFDEREIVDAGFLELVRLGIKSPDDKIIQNSLKVIDQVIRVKTPNGDAFYRYNNDGYGEMDDGRRWNWDGKYTGKGRLWALLSGERGQYELAFSEHLRKNPPEYDSRLSFAEREKLKAKHRLDAMLGFANDGLMIPEQVWDNAETLKNADKQFVPKLKFGEGTGSATPLAWSMAQFIRLAVNLREGRNLDTPKIVYDRYVLGKNKITTTKANSLQSKDECERSKRFFYGGSGNITLPEKKGDFPKLYGGKGRTWSTMIFAYFGNGKDVEIVGDFTGWKQCGYKFQNLSDSKVLTASFPHPARVEYKLIVDGKWITDPLNPNKIDNGVGGENSFFTMPDYKPSLWSIPKPVLKTEPLPKPLDEIEINSKVYGETRRIRVYNPNKQANLPVLYLQDGDDYSKRAWALTVAKNLVSAGKAQPFIIVFLNPKDRLKEYWANDDYAKFVAEEVVPTIDAKYKTIKSREGRAIMGASLGGITSVHAALKYPNVFGKIGGQSSSFWIDDERVVKELEKLNSKTSYKFYFDDGTLEGVEDSRQVVKILKEKGFDVTYIEDEAGHNWTAWRDRLADAFITLMK